MQQQPPMMYNKRPKIYFASQISTCPPTIVVMCNNPQGFPPSYQRYLLGVLRDHLPFGEVPIKFYMQKRDSHTGTGPADGSVPDSERDLDAEAAAMAEFSGDEDWDDDGDDWGDDAFEGEAEAASIGSAVEDDEEYDSDEFQEGDEEDDTFADGFPDELSNDEEELSEEDDELHEEDDELIEEEGSDHSGNEEGSREPDADEQGDHRPKG
ncbi:MAG: hypothetical protein U0892_07150 [Pirellulales bacterium]